MQKGFLAFAGMAQGGHVKALDFVNIPVSILTGVLFGALVGWLLGQFFELLYRKGSYVRNSMKVIIIMGLSFLLMALETMLKGTVAFSGLLAVVSMACAQKMRTPKEVTGRLSAKFGKLWLAAEVVLFVLVGAAVDIRYTMEAGLAAVGMILLALVFRHPVITFRSGKLFHQLRFLYQELYLLLFIDTDQKFLHSLLIALIGGQHTIAAIKMFLIPLEQTPEIRIIE